MPLAVEPWVETPLVFTLAREMAAVCGAECLLDAIAEGQRKGYSTLPSGALAPRGPMDVALASFRGDGG